MTTKQVGAAYNHSCLRVPINPTNRLPLPNFERKVVMRNTYEKKLKDYSKKGTCDNYTDTLVNCSDQISSADSRELRSKTLTPQDNANESGGDTVKESVKSFLHFYESIPDYGDVNHLSDREFYIKLQYLKEKQKTYLRVLDENDFDENKDTGNSERKNSETTGTWLKYYNTDLNLQGKKCDINDKTQFKTFVNRKKVKKYGDSYDTTSYWNKFDNISPSPTVSATSLDNVRKNTVSANSKPSIQINNYLLNSKELDNKTRSNIRKNRNYDGAVKGNYLKTSTNQQEIHKTKTNKLYNESKKLRDAHSASTNKAEDSSSSVTVVDSICDSYSVDDYIPKPKIFYDSDSEQDEILNVPLSQSLPNSPPLKQNKNIVWRDPKITIPKPFNMTLREEEEKRLNLLRYRLCGDFNEVKEESNFIKAHPVPIESQVPLFNKIMAEQENRRHHVRRQCMNELKAQMKPFKFVEQRKQHRLCHSSPDLTDIGETTKYKPFKARPVPRNLFSSYVYQRMHENEYYRNLKKKIRAEEMLKASSLPPSMAARERLSKVRALSAEMLSNVSERPRKRKHRIPDYRKSHDYLRKQLKDRWNDNVTTSPQPFTLRTAELLNRKSARFLSPDHSSVCSPYQRYSPPASRERVRPQSTLGIPLNRNNLASVLRIQSSRQKLERELSVKNEELRKKEEAKVKAKSTRRKPAWQALSYSTEEDLAMRVQTRREEERIRREEFEHDMELMLNRVEMIPTLFERQSQSNLLQNEKRRKRYRSMSGLGMKISSVPVTPDLYEEDEGEEEYINQDEVSDKNLKMGLKVSISETPETIECPSEPEKQEEEDEEEREKHVEDTKENQDSEEKDEDECGNTSSIEEDISAGKSSDDEEGGNTYNIED